MAEEKDEKVKVESKTTATPIKKPTAFDRERIASRQREHGKNVREYLTGGR